MATETSHGKRLLITGGCGFIGTNLAAYFSGRGWSVTTLDNFSRRGSNQNRQWLQQKYPSVRFVEADIRHDPAALEEEVAKCNVIFHLAAQVAVTTSVENPLEDFEINARGTLNLLEAVRLKNVRPTIIYASTNKVYGGMEDTPTERAGGRYVYRDLPGGVTESQPLDFHSPYGCSKGAADQYVRDYARIFNLPTVVLRQSCIYGPRQFGVEDQGWIAWFTIAALLGIPITIYGDGRQVRDVLHVDDLARAYELAIEKIDVVNGQVLNIGGGANFSLAVHEVFPMLEQHLDRQIPLTYGEWRPGDQPVYISDITKARRLLGWQPTIAPEEGVASLVQWSRENVATLRSLGLGSSARRETSALARN
jgi:CDP-paratose 2-epimerase